MCYENNYFCSSATKAIEHIPHIVRVRQGGGNWMEKKDQQLMMMRDDFRLLSIQILTNTKNCVLLFLLLFPCLGSTTRQLIIIIITIFIIGHYFVKK